MFVSDEQRRRRLAHRHALGPDSGLASPEQVATGLVAVHATDPTTVFLTMWARMPAVTRPDVEEALYDKRSLARVMGMRRTLFVVPAATFAVVDMAVARDLAGAERRRLAKALTVAGESDPDGWIRAVEENALEALAAAGEVTTAELREMVPELQRMIVLGSGRWAAELPVATRIAFLLSTEGRTVRTRPRGSWLSGQWRWAPVDDWLGDLPRPTVDEARAELARRYLARFGPVTETDLAWWTGWGKRVTRAALAAIQVEHVETEAGPAVVLAGDIEELPDPGPWVALLPGLDSTVMGWKERDWYLGPHGSDVFDTSGNGGPTVWVDGRIVGGWAQTPDGTVVYELLEEVSPTAREAIDGRAAALTEWLDGPVMPRFPSPLHQRLAGR